MNESSMTETQARDEICRVGKSLFDRGYVHATAGNISVHLDDVFLITPTDACLGFLDPARLSKLDRHGTLISGDRASKTIALHRAIYAATNATASPPRAIIHTHSTHCVSITLNNLTVLGDGPDSELLPPITPYFVMKVGRVPVMPYQRPGATEMIDDVTRSIDHYAKRSVDLRAVMLSRLGPVVWEQTPARAMAALEELEETAKLWIASSGSATPLNSVNMGALKDAFGAVW
jgi:3-dehydro-4-phosphotetronate decarboxylase